MSEPFGALKPSPRQEAFRRIGHRLPPHYAGRKLASLLLGPAGGRLRRAYDVEVFGTQKARLHPYDNICEKRVYLTPQFWESDERKALARAIAHHRGDAFVFADIGANVGLYTLYARSAAEAAGKRLTVIAVEPDPEMRARFLFNMRASGAEHDVQLFPYAAAAKSEPLRFAANLASRGLSRIDPAGASEVEGRGLLDIFTEAQATRIDAMKIDIEGHEYSALESFFAAAREPLWPDMIILETAHESQGRSARALCESVGYSVSLTARRNAVLVRPRNAVTLRPATASDVAQLERWDKEPHVIAATTDNRRATTAFEGNNWRDEIAGASVYSQYFIAELDGRPIGAMQIIDPHLEPTHYWGDIEPNLRALDIWIGEAGALGRGYGERMMRIALDRCFSDPAVRAVVIDPLASNRRARKFYRRLGFAPVGPRRFGGDDCLVHRLERDDWMLRRTSSGLLTGSQRTNP